MVKTLSKIAIISAFLAISPLCADENAIDVTQYEEEISAQGNKIFFLETTLETLQNEKDAIAQHAEVIRNELVEASSELEQVKKELEQAIKKYEYFQKQLEKAKAELLKSEKNNKQLNKDLTTAQLKTNFGIPISAVAGFIAGYFLPSLKN